MLTAFLSISLLVNPFSIQRQYCPVKSDCPIERKAGKRLVAANDDFVNDCPPCDKDCKPGCGAPDSENGTSTRFRIVSKVIRYV
jgi:hypothetical protein